MHHLIKENRQLKQMLADQKDKATPAVEIKDLQDEI